MPLKCDPRAKDIPWMSQQFRIEFEAFQRMLYVWKAERLSLSLVLIAENERRSMQAKNTPRCTKWRRKFLGRPLAGEFAASPLEYFATTSHRWSLAYSYLWWKVKLLPLVNIWFSRIFEVRSLYRRTNSVLPMNEKKVNAWMERRRPPAAPPFRAAPLNCDAPLQTDSKFKTHLDQTLKQWK